jgi:gliding motility-associated-like protein
MIKRRVRISIVHCIALCMLFQFAEAQCPQFPTSSITGNANVLCEGASVTLSVTGQDIPPGSSVDWYIGPSGTFNPYGGEGTLIGSVPSMADPCTNPPEVLYIMVNPDNGQVGGSGDQCDEFLVLWTGSGGFDVDDILVSNLGPGSFQWDSYVAGNAANFSCGVALPPGPVPENAILIIQSSTANNVPIANDILCASGLPVYIISYDGTSSCAGGYFDNNSPCASCPVMIDIQGATCQYALSLDYQPPAATIDGWGWANNGSGVYADVVPPVDIPVFQTPNVIFDDFIWTIPANFCETQGGGSYWITGILNPPPAGACLDIFTPFFGLEISCPELVLSGGGEVCEGNCPDDPTEINFTITGDDTPYIADIVVTVSIFPPVQIDDLEISNGQSITVCLEGIFPSFDPATGILSVPVLAIGLTATVQVVSLVSAAGCPVEVDPDFITLSFIAAPNADAGTDQTICAGETVPVSGSIGGSATEGMWTTDGDGNFADPTALNTTYTPGPSDIAAGEVILTLMGMDPNGSCIPAESSLTVFINPSLSIEVNTPLTICDNDIANIFALVTGSNEPCNWETSGDGDFDDPFAENTFYTPGPADIASGMVILTYVPIDPDACLIFSEPLILTLVEAPDVDIPSNLEVCQGDSIVIAIDIEGDFLSVTWDESGDGELVINSQLEVTYTPGPMDINNQFFIVSVIILSAYPECGQITYNMPVNIILCDCPDLETDPPSGILCAANDVLDLSSILVAGGPGSWSITSNPPGSNPATLSGSLFMTSNADPGPYTVTYTINSPEPGCPSTTSETIDVTSLIQPDAGPDMAFCGPQAVLINGQITPFSPAVPILWETLGDGSFGNNSDLSTTYFPGALDSMSAGLYLVLHVMDPICGDGSDTITLFFNNPPSTSFVNDTIVTCNVSANGSIVDFPSLITGGDASGTWTNTSGVPVDFSNPSSVDFNGIAEGFYLFQYQTGSAMSPCSETIYDIIIAVEDCLCPLLIVQNLPGGVCNSQTGIPLDAFIMAGAPGSWQIINTPPGVNPGTLSGSTFLINGCDPGIYNLRFTFDAAPIVGCPDSAEIEILIQAVPTISISGDTSTCGQTIVQLNAVLGGSAIGVQWSTSGLGVYDDPTSLNPLYTPSVFDVASAQVNLIATAIDTFGFCSVPADTISLFLVTPPSTSFSTLFDTLCNHPDSGSVINFTSFIVQGDGTGFWADIDGAGVDLSDPAQVDFDGIPPGNYRFVYTTQTAVLPCMDSMYVFSVLVEDCACPPLILSNAGVMLCQGEVKDLNEEVISVAPGIWIVADGPAGALFPQLSGSQLSTTGASAGNYTLTYILTDSVPGCPATSSIPLVIEEQPFVTITDIECVSGNTLYEVLVQTNANSVTSDFGDVTTAGTGQFRIASIPEGQDITLLISSASGICSIVLMIPAPDCNCTLFIEDIADTITFCPGDTFVLIPIITGAQGFALSTWITPEGTKMQPTLPLYEEGKYIWIVRDMAGCEERDTFNAEFIGPEGAVLTSMPPSCPGNTDGQVIIDTIIDGTPPYMIQLDNGAVQTVNQLPYTITDVGLGNHVLSITDMIGCTIEVPVVVENQDFGQMDLGPDETIQKGDSVLIQPLAEGIVISSVTWDPPMAGIGIEDFWFAPAVTTLLSVAVQDTAGCLYEDEILITVLEKETFFIANIFSPNGDQINDEVEVNTNLPNDRLVSFEIFDRWGSLLYGQYNNPPFRWDGKSSNELAQTGVYVYKLVWKDQAGRTKVKVGDVTLAR